MYDKTRYRFEEADSLLPVDGLPDPLLRPDGSRVTSEAAQPVFDLLSVPARNAIHFREGGHTQNLSDRDAFVDFFLGVT
jgi:hypothetical protein